MPCRTLQPIYKKQKKHISFGISYNPKGQRERIAYGNGAATEYEYDDKNFRLARLLTTRNGGNDCLQDLRYEYDQMGNIAKITDISQDAVFFNGQAIEPEQAFEYDALYRLTKATGKEHAQRSAFNDDEGSEYQRSIIQSPMPADAAALRNYARQWQYDEAGNIIRLIHSANGNSWARSYSYAADSNRLSSATVGQTTVNYACNEHGSMASMPHLQSMQWDFMERLKHITKGTTDAYYCYDGAGQRIRKVAEKNNASATEERIYLGGFEIFRKREGNVLKLERETLHIMDDAKRIALAETLTVSNGAAVNNPEAVVRYQLGNNIESATLELDETASIINYEEYYPYGDTSYQAGSSLAEVSQKRYRYTGKEKDEESGLYYHGARYYACWLGIFISVDPLKEKYQSISPYAYCMNNPVTYIDPDGKERYYATNGDFLGQVGNNTDVRVLDSTLTNEQTNIYIQNEANDELKNSSVTFVNYFTTLDDVTNDAALQTYTNNGKNCFTAATVQLKKAGVSLSGEVIYTIIADNSKLRADAFSGAIWIQTELNKGNPVMVGVKETKEDGTGPSPTENRNSLTGHFVVIRSVTVDSNGTVTFNYLDNASKNEGKNKNNNFTLDASTGTITDNVVHARKNYQRYDITEVRKNKNNMRK